MPRLRFLHHPVARLLVRQADVPGMTLHAAQRRLDRLLPLGLVFLAKRLHRNAQLFTHRPNFVRGHRVGLAQKLVPHLGRHLPARRGSAIAGARQIFHSAQETVRLGDHRRRALDAAVQLLGQRPKPGRVITGHLVSQIVGRLTPTMQHLTAPLRIQPAIPRLARNSVRTGPGPEGGPQLFARHPKALHLRGRLGSIENSAL